MSLIVVRIRTGSLMGLATIVSSLAIFLVVRRTVEDWLRSTLRDECVIGGSALSADLSVNVWQSRVCL